MMQVGVGRDQKGSAGRRLENRVTAGLLVVLLVLVGILLLAFTWVLSGVAFKISCLLLSSAPFVLVWLQRLIRREFLFYFDFSLILALAFFVFFGAGVLSLDLSSGLRYAALGTVDREFVFENLFWISAIAMAIVTPGLVIVDGARSDRNRDVPDSQQRAGGLRGRQGTLLAVAEACLILSLAGTALTVVQAGSFAAAFDALASHNKETLQGLGSLPGQSLWQIFALPACVGAEAVLLTRRRDGIWVGLLVQLLLLLGTALLLYGSRLLVTLALISLAALYSAAKGVAVKKSVVLGLGVFIVASSIPVLSARTGVDDEVDIKSISSIIGYNIFDVSMASVAVENQLGPKFSDPSRFVTAGSTVVPLVGASPDEVNAIRLDVLVAQYIDGGNSERGYSTGFPPSLPTAFYVAYGNVGGITAGFGFGLVAALACRVLWRRVQMSNSVVALMFYGYAVVVVFNIFKDGDLAVGLAGAFKTTLLLLLLVGFISFVGNRRLQTPEKVSL